MEPDSAHNRSFSKMAAENLNKSKLKTNTRTRKSNLTLVTLPSFSFSGEIWAEKMYVENWKIYRRLYDCTGGIHYTPSHTNVSKFYTFQLTFIQLIFHLKCWNLAGLLKLRCSF